ncbi:hypothetical protein B0T16DRAFT_414567 [Cercophora newfieldiana]|uniref:Uncharacterized protein n=1 Tax=Cercophora newfieldiana TaxID=92897 RepID=A0AA39Y8K3_9PEZI|nr:hypothetical protein B0T16DRAFT_414567 [Cercophora newfieldiana]
MLGLTKVCFQIRLDGRSPLVTGALQPASPVASMTSGMVEALSSRLGSAFRLQYPLKYLSWSDRGSTVPSPTPTPLRSPPQLDAIPENPSSSTGAFTGIIREETGASLSTLVGGQTFPRGQQHAEAETSRRSPASPSSTLASTPNTRLRNGIPLPGTKDMIWVYRPVQSVRWDQEVYQVRFEFVVNELKKAVECHDTLCDRLDGITWGLQMVGASPETSAPAIVVGCHKDDEHALRNVFYKRAQRRLNCRVKPEKPFEPRQAFSTKKPAFNIFILPRPEVPIIRVSTDKLVFPGGTDQQALCGRLVHFEGRSATLGVSLRVGGIDRVLTVQHLFEPHPPSTRASRTGRTVKIDNVSSTEARRAQAPQQLSSSSAYLDWSLIDPPNGTTCHNTLFAASSSSLVQLREIGASPRLHETPVYMASGLHGVRKATLLGGVGYLSTQKGRELCPVWTVVPESGTIEKGESGSVIFDQETLQVYGHVIGADTHLGCGYTVPLTKTIEQIKTAFNTRNVTLSETTSEVPKGLSTTGHLGESNQTGTANTQQNGHRAAGSPTCSGRRYTPVKTLSERAKKLLAWPSLSAPFLIPLFVIGAFIPSILMSLPTTHMAYQIPTDPPFQHEVLNYDGFVPPSPTLRRVPRINHADIFNRDTCVNTIGKFMHENPPGDQSRVSIAALLHQCPVFIEPVVIQPADMTVTLDGCMYLCGDSGPDFPNTVTWMSLAACILPVVVLLMNIELAPGRRPMYALLHALSDPIDTVWSLLHKLQAWSRCYELASSAVPKGPGEGMSRHDARMIATVLMGYEELGTTDKMFAGLSHSVLERINPKTDRMLRSWKGAALELADQRTIELLRTLLAVALYILSVLSALVPHIGGRDRDEPLGWVAVALSLSFLLPIVVLGSLLGVLQSHGASFWTLNRFLRDAEEELAAQPRADTNVSIDGLGALLNTRGFDEPSKTWDRYSEPIHFMVGQGRYPLWKPRDSKAAELDSPRGSHKFGLFVLSLCPALASYSGALLLGEASGARVQLILSCIWLSSATLSFVLRAIDTYNTTDFSRRYRHQQLAVGASLIVLGMTTGFAYATLSDLTPRLFQTLDVSIPLAVTNTYTQRRERRISIVILGTLGFQLLFTLTVMAMYWKGLWVLRGPKSEPSQLWETYQADVGKQEKK